MSTQSKTYQIADVKLAGSKPNSINVTEYLSYLDVTRKNNGKVLHYTQPKYPSMPSFQNGFISAAYEAYSEHRPLVFRPDDVWLAIVLTFANYVDNHAEEMRGDFVNHDGKKELIVTTNGNIMTTNWDDVIHQFSDLIDENTKSEVRTWIEPNFSTTTSKDRLVGRVALMGAMKHYFSYGCCCACGLPSITLEGTLEDWQEVRRRADKLQQYANGVSKQSDLLKWHQILCTVLDQFIETYKGNVDKNFWNGMCDYHGGSGVSYITGWILAFIPFKDGNYRLNSPTDILNGSKYGQVDTSDLKTSTVVEVPVTINDNGIEYKTIFYAGAIMSAYREDTQQICPSYDWAMIDVSNSKENSN